MIVSRIGILHDDDCVVRMVMMMTTGLFSRDPDDTVHAKHNCRRLYLGMQYATFAWHNEDNYLYSLNFHHSGSAKQW